MLHKAPQRLYDSVAIGDAELAVTNDPRYERMQEYSMLAARIAQTALGIAAERGLIRLARIRRILDFGAGMGGPTLALAKLAAITGGSVDVVEKRPEHAPTITEHTGIPESLVHIGDGIEFLRSDYAEGRYDLVTAFMFGPDYYGNFAPHFLATVPAALNRGGRLLMTSDFGTMKFARQACEAADIEHGFIEGLPAGWTYPPDMLVASFDPVKSVAGLELLQTAQRQQPQR